MRGIRPRARDVHVKCACHTGCAMNTRVNHTSGKGYALCVQCVIRHVGPLLFAHG